MCRDAAPAEPRPAHKVPQHPALKTDNAEDPALGGCCLSACFSPEAPPGGLTRQSPCLRGLWPHPCPVLLRETQKCSFPSTQVHMYTHTHTHTHTHTLGAMASAQVLPVLVVSVSFCFVPGLCFTSGELSCISEVWLQILPIILRNPSRRVFACLKHLTVLGAA